MPNLCGNTLYVIGKPKSVAEFVTASKNKRFGKKPDKPDWNGEFHTDRREWRILASIVPCPEELVNTQAIFYTDKKEQAKQKKIETAMKKKYGSANWYDWCNANWGTKWGDYDTELGFHDARGAVFHFNTAWSPANEGFRKVSKLFPELLLVNVYEEGGMSFVGGDAFAAGEELLTVDGDYPDYDDDDDEGHWLALEKERSEIEKEIVSFLRQKMPYHARKFAKIHKEKK